MKKRLFCIMMVLLLVFSFAACGGGGEGTSTDGGDDTSADTGTVTYLTMGTGGVSGTWYPVGGVLASAMSKSGKVSVTAQSSAASIENIRLAGSGERELGMATGGLLVFARDGLEMFEGEQYDNLGSIANMMFMQNQFLVRADAGINTLSDLVGKTVGTGAPGSGDEVFARGFLEAAGVYDQTTPMQLSYAEQVTAFKDRQLDMVFAMASSPTASMLDASSQAQVKMLGLTPEDKAKILEVYPFFVETDITSEHYAFVTEDVPTLGSYTTLFVSLDVPEDVVYEAVKSMFEDLPAIQAAHGSMADFTPENAVLGLPVDLHPGAERYYQEIGVL